MTGAAPRRHPLVAVVALVAAAAIGGGILLGATLVRPPAVAVPSDTSVDAGFARDMQVHHSQAVELSRLVRDRSTDEEVRQVALDIQMTQQHQAGQMYGWLAVWGLPPSSSQAPMAWAGDAHGHTATGDGGGGYAAMPGYVSREDMARLEAATGTDADRIFLELMIPHHEGGVEMARIAEERATTPVVRQLAHSIVESQTAEITALQEMLDARGGPLP